MNRYVVALAAVVLGCGTETSRPGGTGGTGGSAKALKCWIASPTAEAVVNGALEVEVGYEGAAFKVELLAADQILAEHVITDADDGTVTMSVEAASVPEGAVSLSARVSDDVGAMEASEVVAIVADNAPPAIAFGVDRMTIIKGAAEIALTIDEPHLKSWLVKDQTTNQEIANGTDAVDKIAWDVTAVEDRVHWMTFEATDDFDQKTTVTDFPILVVNNGQVMEPVQYSPEPAVAVPQNYDSVEYHTRSAMRSYSLTKRVVIWMTWDPTDNWLIEFAAGQGTCPHRGIKYAHETSRSGEIVLDIARADLPASIVRQLPPADQASPVFPVNQDTRTFGAFFGHAAPLEPESRVGQELPIEIHYVYIWQ